MKPPNLDFTMKRDVLVPAEHLSPVRWLYGQPLWKYEARPRGIWEVPHEERHLREPEVYANHLPDYARANLDTHGIRLGHEESWEEPAANLETQFDVQAPLDRTSADLCPR